VAVSASKMQEESPIYPLSIPPQSQILWTIHFTTHG